MSRYHLCSAKAGLIVDVVNNWPVAWLTDDNGEPFGNVIAAVQAILDVPTEFVPMGCPSPDERGRCPGHAEGGDA